MDEKSSSDVPEVVVDSISSFQPSPFQQPVLKEPDLVTILEGKPLTTEQLEQEQDLGRENLDDSRSYEAPSEQTPLMRSTETNRSTDFHSLTTSQASLFIPSVQFSLYSSRGHDFSHQSRKGSFIDKHSGSVNSACSEIPGYSYSVSILAKIAEDGQASAVLTLWNVINMIQGSGGVLGIPYAISLGGFPALVIILLVGLMTNFTGVLLIDCLYKTSAKTGLRKKVRTSYAEIAASVWGPFGGKLVDFMIVSTCYCTSILLVMMLGSSVMSIFKGVVHVNITEWCLICTCLLLPLVFIRKLHILAWLSMLAVLALIICILVIIGHSIGEWSSWSLHNIPNFNLEKLPVAVGIVVFGYSGHSVFPGIQGSMQEPKKFNKVTYTSFSIVTFCKFILGLFGCLLYGTATQPLVTLNLNQNTALNIFAAVLVIINVYFSYPLNMFVTTETLDILCLPKLPMCEKGRRCHIAWLIASRSVLVFITFAIAIAVPNFGLLMGIFGSVLGACLSFIFPCIFHLKLKWKDLRWYTITAEIAVVVFGVVAGILGLVYSSIALKDL
ncbi:vesicular inhibitory amino acid transporter-like [Actinia tenebrosa]|uniref:Vesicular inhibitory amino acid transporter-like n=1 Tax=Actinia tenebrosa TaxID=6105 RepID=A0A6P8IM91_ACTTE|nr:vesicular inhibitory amino acid transporter-like [Actinia tenebrosa]